MGTTREWIGLALTFGVLTVAGAPAVVGVAAA